MSKKRLSSITSKTRRAARSEPNKESIVGLSLGAGKTDKTYICVLDYYPQQKKVFLARMLNRQLHDKDFLGESSDKRILENLRLLNPKLIAVDAPLQLPLCLTCKLVCPGHEACNQEHILWMWKNFRKHSHNKKPKKVFTPYTQRSVDLYLQSELEKSFIMPHAMGSNGAPFLARSLFLQRQLSGEWLEVFTPLAVWRWGQILGLMPSQLVQHRHSATGLEDRKIFLQALIKTNFCFIYEEDLQMMVDSYHAFDAFICAAMAFYYQLGETVPRPKGFPKKESWVQFLFSKEKK